MRTSRESESPSRTAAGEPITNDQRGGDVFERGSRRPDASGRAGPINTPTAGASRSKPSKYWSNPRKEMDVDIDGYDFDFKPKEQMTGNRVRGFVDGPFSHNGKYEVLKNTKDELKIKAQFGNNRTQDNDMKVTFCIKDNVATISGTAKGKRIPDGTQAQVTGKGTKSQPFQIKFTDANNKPHSLKWRLE